LSGFSEGLFQYCISLCSIHIPSSIGKLGPHCFSYCPRLSAVTFESGSRLSMIGRSAFSDCFSLDVICIPGSVETIGSYCFDGCHNLSIVTFEAVSRLRCIEDYAFCGCSSLKSIFLPDRVEDLTGVSFDYENTDIEIDPESEFLRICDDFLMDLEGHCLIRCFRDSIDVVISNEVDQLSRGCFYGCTNISNVMFENGSHISILDKCLFSESSLKSICVPSSVETISEWCFAWCNSSRL
jgi:hypothetical protein